MGVREESRSWYLVGTGEGKEGKVFRYAGTKTGDAEWAVDPVRRQDIRRWLGRQKIRRKEDMVG